MLLTNKVALITGAASGIGRATAQLFAREGAKIVAADINEAGLRETVTRICDAGGDAIDVKTDVGQMEQVQAMVQAALDRYGRLDIVHSNAAAYATGTATEITEDQWDRTIDVCLKAAWMIAHCAVPSMLANGGGVIVITGSVHAIRGYPKYIPYQAAKGGLMSLTRALAADYAPKIRVNAVLPGAVETGLWDGLTQSERDEIAQMCPLKRNGQPEDIANVALFLASDMSAYMTGESVVVDGGLTSIIQLPEKLAK